MIKLRLKRYGKSGKRGYRIVAIASVIAMVVLEELGFYNPRTDETKLDVPGLVKTSTGAHPLITVRRILEKANVFEQVSASATQ